MTERLFTEVFTKEYLDSITEHEREVLNVIMLAVAKHHNGVARYGTEDWFGLGSKGLFADVTRKYNRLKRIVWHGKPAGSETTDDTILDGIIYQAFIYMALKREGGDAIINAMKSGAVVEVTTAGDAFRKFKEVWGAAGVLKVAGMEPVHENITIEFPPVNEAQLRQRLSKSMKILRKANKQRSRKEKR